MALIILVGDFGPGIIKKNLNYNLGAYGHMYSRVKEVENSKNVDILFLGSSHSYRGFDPRIFKKNNYNIFNFGSSSQSPIQQEVLLSQYLTQLNPKCIVFEVYPKIFESDGVESALDILSNNTIDMNSVNMCFKTNNIKTYNTLLYAYYKQVFGLNSSFKEARVKDKDAYIIGGYVEKEISYYKSIKNNKKTYHFNEMQISVFKNIMKSLSEKKINCVLVQAPITRELYNSYTNNHEVDSIFKSFGKYYNFNEILQLNDSLFYDAHHLNQNGVEIFNNFFINILQKDTLLKN